MFLSFLFDACFRIAAYLLEYPFAYGDVLRRKAPEHLLRELPLGQKSVLNDFICRFQQIKLNVLFVYRICLFCDKAPVLKSFSEVDTWDLVDFRTLTISAAVRYWGLLCKNIRISYSRCLS